MRKLKVTEVEQFACTRGTNKGPPQPLNCHHTWKPQCYTHGHIQFSVNKTLIKTLDPGDSEIKPQTFGVGALTPRP